MSERDIIARAIYEKWPDGGDVRTPNTAGGYDNKFVADEWEDVGEERREECLSVGDDVVVALAEEGRSIVDMEELEEIADLHWSGDWEPAWNRLVKIISDHKAMIGAGK